MFRPGFLRNHHSQLLDYKMDVTLGLAQLIRLSENGEDKQLSAPNI
jgi:hypothetical protein